MSWLGLVFALALFVLGGTGFAVGIEQRRIPEPGSSFLMALGFMFAVIGLWGLVFGDFPGSATMNHFINDLEKS